MTSNRSTNDWLWIVLWATLISFFVGHMAGHREMGDFCLEQVEGLGEWITERGGVK